MSKQTQMTWTQETVCRFRLVGTVIVTLEAGTCGLLCARSELGTLLAVGTMPEFRAFASKAKASIIDKSK